MPEPKSTITCWRCGRLATLRYDGLPARHRVEGGEWCGGHERTAYIAVPSGDVSGLRLWVLLTRHEEPFFLLCQPTTVARELGEITVGFMRGEGGTSEMGNEIRAYHTLSDALHAMDALGFVMGLFELDEGRPIFSWGM